MTEKIDPSLVYGGTTKRYFIYVATANVALATALLNRYSVVYDSHDSINPGMKEVSFIANREIALQIASEIFNGTAALTFKDSKLDISATVGISNTIGDVKVGSTDDTGANSHYVSVNSACEIVTAPPTIVRAGSKTTTAADALVVGANATCRNVTVQADQANTNTMLIGNATTQNVGLLPGQSINLDISNLGNVYVKSAADVDATAIVANFIGSV